MSGQRALLITGGSGGLGHALAHLLSESGVIPVVSYASGGDRAHALAAECGGVALSLDLTSMASIASSLDQLEEQNVDLDGAILAASPHPQIKPFGRITEEDLYLQWKVNVMGHHHLLAGLIKRFFRKRKSGSVVGVLSGAMSDDESSAMPRMSAYLEAKYGLYGVLECARAEFPWLHVDHVHPGFIDTGMLSAFDERFVEMAKEGGQVATPESVAEMIMKKVSLP